MKKAKAKKVKNKELITLNSINDRLDMQAFYLSAIIADIRDLILEVQDFRRTCLMLPSKKRKK